jgi:hypothetical protein
MGRSHNEGLAQFSTTFSKGDDEVLIYKTSSNDKGEWIHWSNDP